MHQKRRALDADCYRALQDEVDHLLKIGFIRESYYPNLLANPVLVIKPNEKWRTCIKSEQSMSKRQLSPASNRPTGRYDGGTRAIKLHRCVL